MITEKQVRNAIRRKLNTESRTFRGLGKVASGVRRSPTKRRPRQTPRPQVSIERSNHNMHQESKPMLQHQQQQVTQNFSLEKPNNNLVPGIIFRAKDGTNLTSTALVNRVQQQQQGPQPHQTQQYMQQTITTVGGVTATAQGMSLAANDKRPPDDEVAAASAAAYFNSNASTPTPRGVRDRTPPPPSHHTPTPNSGTPPLGAANLPPSTSPSTSIADKSFNLVKAEVGGGSGGATQYISQQDYSYLTHVSSQPSYLSHHITDPTYLRRLEMSQAAVAAQHTTAAAALSYSYPTLPTSESMEPSLHM